MKNYAGGFNRVLIKSNEIRIQSKIRKSVLDKKVDYRYGNFKHLLFYKKFKLTSAEKGKKPKWYCNLKINFTRRLNSILRVFKSITALQLENRLYRQVNSEIF